MANDNHDEHGRFTTGESAGINYQKGTGKKIAPFKGKVVSHIGTQVTIRSGNKTVTAHQDFVFRDKSGQDKAFRKSLAKKNSDIAAAHAKAAAKIKSDGHHGQAGVKSFEAENPNHGKAVKIAAAQVMAKKSRIATARKQFFKDTATLYK